MNRIRIVLLAAVAALAAMAVAVTAQAGTPTLTATVGPGFTITLKQGGAAVKSLKAGTYTIKVSDKSPIHNFNLSGPGVNKKTALPYQGTQTWSVTLKKGTYKFVCDPHAAIMKGSFTVS